MKYHERISEKAFQAQILQLAAMYGWLCYHTYDSRRCAPGYPDLALCHPDGQYLLAELKSQHGRLRAAQRMWIDALHKAGIECHIWRPRDWPAIQERLTRQAIVSR